MNALIAFWSYAIAACLFASIILWRLRERLDHPGRLLVGAYFATAAWASVSAIRGPVDLVTIPAETIRNLSWIILLHAISGDLKEGSRRSVRLVFGAIAMVIGVQLVLIAACEGDGIAEDEQPRAVLAARDRDDRLPR